MKEALPHGSFEAWAEQELGISPRAARNYMQLSRWLPGKSATVAELPPTILYKLSAPNAAEDVVQEVLVQAGAGARLDAKAIEAKLDAARAAKAAVRSEQRRFAGLTPVEAKARVEKRYYRK